MNYGKTGALWKHCATTFSRLEFTEMRDKYSGPLSTLRSTPPEEHGWSEADRTQKAQEYAHSSEGDGRWEVPLQDLDYPETLHPSNHFLTPRQRTDRELQQMVENSPHVQVEACSFMVNNGDCDNRRELLIRARNHAEMKTSSLSINASRVVVAAFVDKVSELSRSAPRKQANTKRSAAVEDFPAEFLYLDI
jgi:hypothetical protein